VKRTLAALAVSVLLISGGSASAAPSKPAHCKVLSVQTVQQSRDMNGVVVGIKNGEPVYGHGIQHRTQTTTTERCRGKLSTLVTYSTWAY